MNTRVLLHPGYVPVLSPRLAGSRIRGVVRYLAAGTRGRAPDRPAEVKALVRSVGGEIEASSPLFGPAGPVSERSALGLGGYVEESVRDLHPKWATRQGGGTADARRAAYHLLITCRSQERLDLRGLTGLRWPSSSRTSVRYRLGSLPSTATLRIPMYTC